eukprot:gene19588-biopygen14544
MRWTGTGEYTTEVGHKVWYCGQEKRKQHGVGFIVEKRTANSVLECTPVSERIISIRIASKPFNTTIIQVYAPKTDYEDQAVDVFYEDLEALIEKTPKKDLLVVLGDWNAQIGEDANHRSAGKFGYDVTNERGMKLLEFAERQKFVVANTLHRHKTSRRTTWHAPDGETQKQIDYILVPMKLKSSVNKAKTRTFNKPDIGSDHDLVMTTIKLKLSTKKENEKWQNVFDLEKLKDDTIRAKFQSELQSKYAPLLLLDDQQPQKLCNEFTSIRTKTAESVLGKRRKTRRPWISGEVLDCCDRRRELKSKSNESEEKMEEYRKANKEVRRQLRKAKEEWVEEQARLVESNFEMNNTRKVFKTIQNLAEQRRKQINVIEDKDGKVLSGSTEVSQRWKEYCNELYNYKADVDRNILNEDAETRGAEEDKKCEVLRSEVEAAIGSLKKNKSPGMGNISAELIQNGGEDTVTILHELCNPKKWSLAFTVDRIHPHSYTEESKQQKVQ